MVGKIGCIISIWPYYNPMSGQILKFLAIVSSGFAIASPSIAQQEPLVLKPSSNWTVDYADDSCRLIRQFGSEEEKSFVIFTSFEPGDEFELTLAGKPFEIDAVEQQAVIKFAPTEDEQSLKFMIGEVGGLPALIFTGRNRIVAASVAESALMEKTNETGYRLPRINSTRKVAVDRLVIGAPLSKPVNLDLGGMGKPFAALSDCINDLVSHWGIDVEKHKSLSSYPKPLGNPGTWITVSDYTREMVLRGIQGIVHFRLAIDENGNVGSCHIQQATQPEKFGKIVCKRMMQRAEFSPALDKDGTPIASYYRNTVRFEIPQSAPSP